MTEYDAAILLGVCDRTLRKLRQQNRIPHALVGNQVRYIRRVLIDWLNAGGTIQKGND